MACHTYRDYIIQFLNGEDIEYRSTIGRPNPWHRVTCLGAFDQSCTEFRKAEKFRYGQRFRVDGLDGEYLLSQVGEGMACLISLEYGNRLIDPIKVDNNNITSPVISRLTSDRAWECVK